jgi:CHAD domain-containing protein
VTEVRRFVVATTGDPSGLLTDLAERARLQVASTADVERTFLDTPDGRLDAAGVVLELRRPLDGGASPTLVWTEDGRTVASAPLTHAEPPRFADDLPNWPAVDRLAALLDVRALVPGPAVRSRLTTLALLDGEEKTTARVVVDTSVLTDGTHLPTAIELHELRGYGREAEKLQKRLVSRLALERDDATAAARARAAAGAAPFLRGKLRISLPDGITAADAYRVVLRALTDVMTDNFAGTIADIDSEFLHDFRVAVRRTRSVLKEGKGVVPPETLAEFRDGFKWLGDVTTPQRDADVQLLDLPELAATLPPERRDALGPLRELLVEHQAACHAQLVAELRSLRRAELGRDWADFLQGDGPWPADDGGPIGSDTPDALRPAIAVAAHRIAKARKRLVRDGSAVDEHSPPQSLHELRKDAKRLRYLLETFGSLFPADDVATAVKPLKALQDTLGRYQDTHVQAQTLAEMGDRLAERGAPAATLLALGGVIEHVDLRGERARDEFAERFATFAGDKVAKAYRRLSEDAAAAERRARGAAGRDTDERIDDDDDEDELDEGDELDGDDEDGS